MGAIKSDCLQAFHITMLITFSGLDGAGKTTLIDSLKAVLEKQNYRVTALTMYGQVSLYGIIRLFRDRVTGTLRRSAPKKLRRHQISANSDFLSNEAIQYGRLQKLIVNIFRRNAIKRCVFVLDLFILLIFRLYLEKLKKHIFILDRYFYDFLADVADGRRWLYIRAFLLVAPTPDIAIFVDVSPDNAFSRKGEYSVEHLAKRRTIYIKIFQWVHNIVFIPNDDLEQTQRRIEGIVLEYLCDKMKGD